jgi:hypothetical protein
MLKTVCGDEVSSRAKTFKCNARLREGREDCEVVSRTGWQKITRTLVLVGKFCQRIVAGRRLTRMADEFAVGKVTTYDKGPLLPQIWVCASASVHRENIPGYTEGRWTQTPNLDPVELFLFPKFKRRRAGTTDVILNATTMEINTININ